ncbi:MAG: hypothetical protein AAGG50_14470 [Bacteroidota bacterium]
MFTGTPEQLAQADTATARFMREELARHASGDGAADVSIDLNDPLSEEDSDVADEEEQRYGRMNEQSCSIPYVRSSTLREAERHTARTPATRP